VARRPKLNSQDTRLRATNFRLPWTRPCSTTASQDTPPMGSLTPSVLPWTGAPTGTVRTSLANVYKINLKITTARLKINFSENLWASSGHGARLDRRRLLHVRLQNFLPLRRGLRAAGWASGTGVPERRQLVSKRGAKLRT